MSGLSSARSFTNLLTACAETSNNPKQKSHNHTRLNISYDISIYAWRSSLQLLIYLSSRTSSLDIKHSLLQIWLFWLGICSLCSPRALWIVRNKLTIEGKLINKPAHVIVQMMIFILRWRALTRRRDRDLLDATREAVRRLHARMAGWPCEEPLLMMGIYFSILCFFLYVMLTARTSVMSPVTAGMRPVCEPWFGVSVAGVVWTYASWLY
jgi:hypothetical protein